MEVVRLTIWDYVIFGLMIVASSAVGLYHGYQSNKKKQNSESDYLLAGRNMTWFPLFISLVASYLSAIALLSTKWNLHLWREIYFHCALLSALHRTVCCYLCTNIQTKQSYKCKRGNIFLIHPVYSKEMRSNSLKIWFQIVIVQTLEHSFTLYYNFLIKSRISLKSRNLGPPI